MKNARQIIESILKQRLSEAHPSEDPVASDCASALLNALVELLEGEEGDIVVSNAFEYMMGSGPDEERLTLGRYEDVEAVAEIVVQNILRDPDVHDLLHNMAASMLRSAMEAMRS